MHPETDRPILLRRIMSDEYTVTTSSKEGLHGMIEWMHDPDISRYFRDDMLDKTKEDVLKFIEQADIVPLNEKCVHYAVVEETDEYLGTISLKAINMRDKNAEYAISLGSGAQGRGVGYAATRELLDLAFNRFGFEKIYLNVLADNTRAIQLYEKCGFVLKDVQKGGW